MRPLAKSFGVRHPRFVFAHSKFVIRHPKFSFVLFSVCIALFFSLQAASVQAQSDRPKYVLGVMPFLNVTKSPDYDWLSLGIAETLTNRLAGVAAIRVVERARIGQILAEQKIGMSGFVDPKTAAEVGKIVGAGKLIIGSYQIIGDNLLIQARIIDVETSIATDPFEAEGPLRDILSHHYKVLAGRAVEILGGISLTSGETKKLVTPETESLAVYELDIKANILLTGSPAGVLLAEKIPREDLLKAAEYSAKATEIDPKDAFAYISWGNALARLGRDEEAIEKFRRAGELWYAARSREAGGEGGMNESQD